MNNKGVALLTVLLVMIMGLILTALTTFLVVRGYQTHRSSKNYQIALQMAQGGLEEAIIDLETLSYSELQHYTNPNSQSGASYEIWQVFWKPLSGFGGVPVFPPLSGAYTGTAGCAIYYLIKSTANQGDSQADLYAMYMKGY